MVIFTSITLWVFLKLPQNARLKLKPSYGYSTVTDLARFLGWSMSVPLKRATS